MVDAALRAAGHRVGRYTSPHLVRLEERFADRRRAGRPRRARRRRSRDVRDGGRALRATARSRCTPRSSRSRPPRRSCCFARAGVESPSSRSVSAAASMPPTSSSRWSTAITSIALDHEQQLGPTLEAIAVEKAGIIKPGVPVVVGALPDEARGASSARLRERGAALHDAADECVVDRVARGRADGRCISRRRDARYPPLVLALRGDHQVGERRRRGAAARDCSTSAACRVPAARSSHGPQRRALARRDWIS